MPVEIKLSIDDEQADAIAAAFDRQADRGEACRLFASLALDHFYAWISGTRRYRSLTEQQAAWIEDIYERLLPPTEGPSVNRLYNSFNLSHGQAVYVSRVLADKALKQWRKQALKDLAADIEMIWPTANGHISKNEKNRVVRTSKLSALELQRLSDEAWRADKSFISPAAKGGIGDQRVFEIAADSVRIIRDGLKGW
jgi:hypothetical protein